MTKTLCFFASDLHGDIQRYQKLFRTIKAEQPEAVFLGGDLLPSHLAALTAGGEGNFIRDVLIKGIADLRASLTSRSPRIFLILGNDDLRSNEPLVSATPSAALWSYVHTKRVEWKSYTVYGYSCIPPTPFRLKDWERYDVSRYVDPGCISPEEGVYSVEVSPEITRYSTIGQDLQNLTDGQDLSHALMLFHAPPYDTNLDLAALDGVMIDHVPLDPHIGSIAIKRFIESRQPYITMHGHVHESARLTGEWKQQIGKTIAFSAGHDGPELALVRFTLESPGEATRELL